MVNGSGVMVLVPVSGLQASEDEKKMKKYDAKRDFGLKIWKIEEKCLNLQRSVLVVPEAIQTIRCFFNMLYDGL